MYRWGRNHSLEFQLLCLAKVWVLQFNLKSSYFFLNENTEYRYFTYFSAFLILHAYEKVSKSPHCQANSKGAWNCCEKGCCSEKIRQKGQRNHRRTQYFKFAWVFRKSIVACSNTWTHRLEACRLHLHRGTHGSARWQGRFWRFRYGSRGRAQSCWSASHSLKRIIHSSLSNWLCSWATRWSYWATELNPYESKRNIPF